MKHFATLVIPIAAALVGLSPSNGAAQIRMDCDEAGLIFVGVPFERVVVGPEGPEISRLSPSEAQEYRAVISCASRAITYTSRNDNALIFTPSGCFFSFLDASSGSAVHGLAPDCSDLYSSEELQYSEVLRTGIYQIIYRGRIQTFQRP